MAFPFGTHESLSRSDVVNKTASVRSFSSSLVSKSTAAGVLSKIGEGEDNIDVVGRVQSRLGIKHIPSIRAS